MRKFLHNMKRRANIVWRRYISRITYEQITVWRRRSATGVGAIALGLAALAFAQASDAAQSVFWHIHAISPYLPLVLTPATFVLAVYVTRVWMPEVGGSGIPQVIAASRDATTAAKSKLVSIPTAIGKFLMTMVGLVGGGSFGREGPTVQISAAIMIGVHRMFGVPITPGVLIAGGAAGVAAAFNTPLAGVAFAIEELAARYEQRVAVLVMAAVMISGMVSLGIAGDYVYFGAMQETLSVRDAVIIAPLVGIVGGLLGGLFSRLVLAFTRSAKIWVLQIKDRPLLFAGGCGLVVAILGVLTNGDTFGTGYETARRLIGGEEHSLWFAPAKFIATLASAATGSPGGIFAPSLAIGAGVGNAIATLFQESSTSAIVALGMAAYFTGVVRAPLTAVIIVSEATASRGMILPMFTAALIAEGASALVSRERLYHGLSKAFLPPEKK